MMPYPVLVTEQLDNVAHQTGPSLGHFLSINRILNANREFLPLHLRSPPSLTMITAITQHHDHRRRSPPPLFTTEASSTSKSLALTSEIHFQVKDIAAHNNNDDGCFRLK
ncbi:hypothetical protein LguiA_011352 [Lonicera macranthoides]